MMLSVRSASAALAALGLSVSAQAAFTYGFAPVTNSVATNVNAGQAQLSVTVDAGSGPNQAKFTFNNSGPAAMSITDVYFDDGTLLGIASIVNGTGVNFSQGATPGNLPGANGISPAFQTTAGFSADSNPPVQPNGVNPGESLTIIFNLLPGKTFADTISALTTPTPTNKLRIGIHVQGFANGGSESFVHLVPAPGAATLIGLAGLLAARRRR